MTESAERPGVRHLNALAQRPRPAGGEAERAARAYASRELIALGFHVRERSFEYSEFPGRYAVPIGGAALLVTLVLAACFGLSGNVALAAWTLVAGTAMTGVFAWWISRDARFTMRPMRATSVNLEATRTAESPRVWLVAHLDSKSQPVPSALRIAGIVVLLLTLVAAAAAMTLTLSGVDVRMVWWGVLGTAVASGLPVCASVVGSRSAGAVDNASGVASALVAASLLSEQVACGVLLPSAEELGLAGVRAWARGRAPGVALNCDGVDDDGDFVIMFNGTAPQGMIDALQTACGGRARVRRMPLGMLTDSSALASLGWSTVTVSRGSFATLRRIHTPTDSLSALRGVAIDDAGAVLARAAEALAQ